MKYSKSLDLVIAALTYGMRGNTAKAAAFFDKALTMKDLKSTIASLDKTQATAHKALVASFTAPKAKSKTTAELMRELAAKRKSRTQAAKLPFPGAAPPFKKKSESESLGEDKDLSAGDDFDSIADRMTTSSPTTGNGPAKDARPVNGPFGGGMTTASDDADEDDFDLDTVDEDTVEMPEASAEDIDVGFNDKMSEEDPDRPSVDGEGQPRDDFSETAEDDEKDEEDDPDEVEPDEDEDDVTTARLKRVQANLRSLSKLSNRT